MTKITVVFHVDPDDLYQGLHGVTGSVTKSVRTNLVRLIQHSLYDDHDGPQLSGQFELAQEYVVHEVKDGWRVWHEPDRLYVDGVFHEYDNAQLYADMLGGNQ